MNPSIQSISYQTGRRPNLGAVAAIFRKATGFLFSLSLVIWGGPTEAGCPLGRADLGPKAQLMRNIRIGNMRFPQALTGIRLQMLSSFILAPVPAASIFSDPDVTRYQRLMDSAHAIHGITIFSQTYEKAPPNSTIVPESRPLEIARSALYRLAYDLVSLIALLEPDNNHIHKIVEAIVQALRDDQLGEQGYTNADAIAQIDLFFKSPHPVATEMAQAILLFLQSPQAETLSKDRIRRIDSLAPALAADPNPSSQARLQLDEHIVAGEKAILRELKIQMSRSHPATFKIVNEYLNIMSIEDSP